MENKLELPVTTIPLFFPDQLNPKHPKSPEIEPNRLASPSGNSSPPGSSSAKPRKNVKLHALPGGREYAARRFLVREPRSHIITCAAWWL
ncbi:hypothetical protein DEO72_LG7g682 [Vigna unguiculata]|uniref:Uncharacterized protein n=1 Tax=Vigna unguiculata TaxID=3917 RepID=A0A4D6MFZ1_VIGUN|nr:hypothetical protein DEO72_LG7g682 [Vigna unguiculata]